MPRSGNATWNLTGSKSLGSACSAAAKLDRPAQELVVTRSVVYEQKKRQHKDVGESDHVLLQLLDAEYTRYPFYGPRRMTQYLC